MKNNCKSNDILISEWIELVELSFSTPLDLGVWWNGYDRMVWHSFFWVSLHTNNLYISLLKGLHQQHGNHSHRMFWDFPEKKSESFWLSETFFIIQSRSVNHWRFLRIVLHNIISTVANPTEWPLHGLNWLLKVCLFLVNYDRSCFTK